MSIARLVPTRRVAVLWVAVALASSGAQAQATLGVAAAPHNVVQLSASAQQELLQDWLTAVLVSRHQASDAATVQNQLKHTLDRALAQARVQAGPALQVSTGSFMVQPRLGRDGQVLGWQGSAELLLQGRDVARIASLAAALPGMAVSQMHFSLSREASERVEAEVRQQAIARFRAQAQEVAQHFGFQGYTLREVTISEAGLPPPGRMRVMVASAEMGAAMDAAPVPAEPGRSLVQVQVSGSVQLR